ncbi:MAG TPA: zinc-binding dehydrogenase [Acidimicrobiia bacterium]|nr:zinc-binding dehydrogenase [Acidimicrobiia bacterium]
MRGVVARRHHLLVEEFPEPTPAPGEALVALRACGICGSDLHTLAHPEMLPEVAAASGLEGRFDPDGDFYLGHEWVGEVLDFGAGTSDPPVQRGDLVVSMPYLVRPPELVALGFSNDHYAGYCERFLLTADLCHRVPRGLDVRLAALTEPMAVGLHAVNKARLAAGDTALVVGCGPIGLALIAWLRARGVEPIVACDYSAQRRGLAERLGAHVVVDPRDEPGIDAWQTIAAGRPVVIFEAVGVPGMLDEVIVAAPAQARVVVAGVCMQPDRIRPLFAIIKELNVQFVYAYDDDEFTATLHALDDGSLDVAPMVTGRVGFEGVAAAFELLGAAEHHVKVLVEPDGPAQVATL